MGTRPRISEREASTHYSNETQTRWDRGDSKVQLNQPNNTRPMGFCDGSDADIAEMQEMAESEGADEMRIDKKLLKSGREIWTLHGGGWFRDCANIRNDLAG